jgi:hypothetical protein
MCGSDVQGKWICPSRLPAIFYIGTDENDKFIKSSFIKAELINDSKIKLINKKEYNGCPYWRKNDPFFN